jgi:hypothetical protein
MNVLDRQLASSEQEAVLRRLARAAARPGCRFLEVGSWCGDSTVILAEVAREFGGRLFCVDWWQGNAGTELADIACRQDVFAIFWQRIRDAGLDEVVVPIRGRSEVVMDVLKENSFDFVFLDADHRYQAIKHDIAACIPMVRRDGGILCGHDCEGNISDYDPEFLAAGKDIDCHESVHCGVICAVGEAFERVSLNHSVWSVRASAAVNGWEPTNLSFSGVSQRKQTPPPTIAATRSHNLLRHGKHVYAVPHSLSNFDVTDAEQRNQPGILAALSLAETATLAREQEEQERARREALERARKEAEERLRLTPSLREEDYLGFNIVAYAGCYYALAQDIGPIDIPNLASEIIADLKRHSRLFIAESHQAARLQIQAHTANRTEPGRVYV